MKLTALDSDRWEELNFNHSCGDLPQSLVEFLDPQASFAAKAKSLDVINDQIFHQTTTYDATFVVLPILISSCPEQHVNHRFWICHLAGLVSLEQGDFPKRLSSEEIETYLESHQLAYDHAIELLQDGIEKDCDWVLILACVIFALRGERDLGWRLKHGTEEDFHKCSVCKSELESRAQCIFVRQKPLDDPAEYLNFSPNEKRYATPIKRRVDGELVTPRAIFSKDSLEGWITSLCEQNGHPKCGQWLRYFFGSTTCPNCKTPVELLGSGIPN